ncbi:Plasma membrane low glucose sensor [Coniosporium tulheliwenetii]|uniref:Plasma membrane low glucose sensor n=1 Tax=Coniosporium tulheliwenetii TaxID=3383036 RepID=A0ACC2ZL94_9PEZI|nr:Plasma membrane low glucose sensor [Cladosporium sp. JES 115]
MPVLIKKPPGTPGSSFPAILIGLFVAFGGILFGYDTGTIGGILAMPYWRREFSTGFINPEDGLPDVTASETSEIVSLLSAGTFFGALTAAPTCDFFGRRLGLIIACAVFCLGIALQTAATATPLFVAGRFFAGYGVGMVSASIPLYQSETAPKWIRGTVVGAYQLAITIGLLLAAIVDNATKDPIILVVGMIVLPETPRFHIKKGRPEKAAKSLSRLRRLDVDHPALIEELGEITANHDFIFYHGTQFFKNSGIGDPFTVTLITSCVNVGSTFPGLYLVEAWGRRDLLLFGAIGMVVCQFIVAIVGTVAGTNDLPAQRTLIAFVCIYTFFFACSWGPVAWVVTGEIFPLKVRAKALSMTTACNWLFNWAIAYATPYLVNPGEGNANLGAKVFFIWGGCCFICIFFVWAFIYETKGLSLEQVDELYGKVNKAWKSKKFVPTVSFQDVRDVGETRHMSRADVESAALRKKSVAYSEGQPPVPVTEKSRASLSRL